VIEITPSLSLADNEIQYDFNRASHILKCDLGMVWKHFAGAFCQIWHDNLKVVGVLRSTQETSFQRLIKNS